MTRVTSRGTDDVLYSSMTPASNARPCASAGRGAYNWQERASHLFVESDMDDLDRLFRRLVENIRNGYPAYLSHHFEVSELYQNLIPYRHNRRETGIETNQDYEVALCRLLTGERGFLAVDDAMAGAIRAELATPNPNTAIFREFAASRVVLLAGAQQRADEMMVDSSAVPHGVSSSPSPRESASPSPASPRPSWAARGSSTSVATTIQPTASAMASTSTSSRGDSSCRYCGGNLPDGRRVAFCPHCGQNLTIQRCPACGTELEISWKFCITCGRGIATS